MRRLVILISGNGSNLQAILDACASGELNAEVVAVIANKADAFGLERARRCHIPALSKTLNPDQSRAEYDQELAAVAQSYQPDWIILAGWMRLLTHSFLQAFPDKVINLHPALPGMFPGAQAIKAAFAAYQRGEINHTGVMVHLVPDEGVDCGPVLGQEKIPILAGDSLESLTARLHQLEHRLLINVLKKLTTGE
jgi:formyltetrahydrofolate-dependent phosphoribosylglycinamide formyltransferase